MATDIENQMILDNIEEFLNDENKVVTYKWLSLTLSIHVNISKRLLEEYYHKHSNGTLQAIYFLTGVPSQDYDQKIQCLLAKESSLNDIKAKFDEVTSCHIYSVQRSSIKNSDVLHQTDVDITQEKVRELPKLSSIRCETTEKVDMSRQKRNLNETKSYENTNDSEPTNVIPSQKTEVKKEVSKKQTAPFNFFTVKSTNNKTSSNEGNRKTQEEKEETVENKHIKSEELEASDSAHKHSKKVLTKCLDLSNAFFKSTVKKTQTNKEEKSVNEVKNKTTEESSTSIIEKRETVDDENKEIYVSPIKAKVNCSTSIKRKSAIEDSDSDDDFECFVKKSKSNKYAHKQSKLKAKMESDEEDDVDVVAPTPEPVKVKSKIKRRKTKQKSVDQEDEPKEKQKEIYETTSSPETNNKPQETSLSPGTNNKPQETSLSPETNNKSQETSSSPGNNHTREKRRKRRRVLKSKQFVDKDGFMVTQKGYESESYSDESDEKQITLPTEKQIAIVTKKTEKELENQVKQDQGRLKHQASLTSFFKRK